MIRSSSTMRRDLNGWHCMCRIFICKFVERNCSIMLSVALFIVIVVVEKGDLRFDVSLGYRMSKTVWLMRDVFVCAAVILGGSFLECHEQLKLYI